MKKYKIAAILMIIHGGFMEILCSLMMIPAILSGAGESSFVGFNLEYFRENLNLMIVAGVIFGVLRVIGAVGLLKNRMWGFALSVIISSITLALMMFLLPAGIVDGILAGGALVLMLMQYFGDSSASK